MSKTTHPCSQEGGGQRMTSKEGLRWANSRKATRIQADGSWCIFDTWTLWHRINGKAIRYQRHSSTETATIWVGGAA